MEVDDASIAALDQNRGQDPVGNDSRLPVLRIDVSRHHVELQLRHDPANALVCMEPGRPEQMRALAHDLRHRACSVLDLAADLVVADLGQPGMGHRVAPDLVPRLHDAAHVVRAFSHALTDQEEGRARIMLVQ